MLRKLWIKGVPPTLKPRLVVCARSFSSRVNHRLPTLRSNALVPLSVFKNTPTMLWEQTRRQSESTSTELIVTDDELSKIKEIMSVDGTSYHENVLDTSIGVKKASDLKHLSEHHFTQAGIPVVPAAKILLKIHGLPAAVDPAILTPNQALEILANKSVVRGQRPFDEVLVSATLGGCFLAFGGSMFALIASGSPALQAACPGLLSVLAASVFPIGLNLIVFTGTDLLTGNMMYSVLPFVTHTDMGSGYHLRSLGKIWTANFIGNFAGSIGIAALVAGTFSNSTMAPWLAAVAAKKCTITIPAAIVKGIGANWLVNLGIYFGNIANTPVGRVIGLWLPVWVFVSLGFEHSVANMFVVPLAILSGATEHTFTDFVVHNLGWVMLGNTIGGGFFCGGLHWYLNRRAMSGKLNTQLPAVFRRGIDGKK